MFMLNRHSCGCSVALGGSGEGDMRQAIEDEIVLQCWVKVRTICGRGVFLLLHFLISLHHLLLLLQHLLSTLHHHLTLFPFCVLLCWGRCFHSIPVRR